MKRNNYKKPNVQDIIKSLWKKKARDVSYVPIKCVKNKKEMVFERERKCHLTVNQKRFL